MLRTLLFPFSLFIGIISLIILAVGLDNDSFLLANAEKEQQEYQLQHSISALLNDNGGYNVHYRAAFIKELESYWVDV
ncbi:MAG TPA: hypothetical protein VE548_15455 [Nitrososphaeraceae archaeon]|jgi:hypothetical protein|nr:hypothetical protein [Nitrososphaeraceae archaeon]